MSTAPTFGFELPQQSANGRARAKALAAAAGIGADPTSLVAYRSTGALVIIGPAKAALAAAARLPRELHCTVVAQDDPKGQPKAPDVPPGVQLLYEKVLQVSGHLGQYAVVVNAPPPQGGINLLQKLASQRTHFDLVLDLCDPPFLQDELLPFGYYAPCSDAERLEKALAELPDMVGEFEKPRFFNYNPDICAHGANGLVACTRCIDACPAGAIISMRDEVAVDPYKCQGAGACATACPTGAMTYAYPSIADHLTRMRELLKVYRAEGGTAPVIMYHDAENGRDRVAGLAPRLPERVIPVEIAELGSAGMDAWLSALAYGAARVVLLPTATTPRSVLAETTAQIGFSRPILEGMGYPGAAVTLLEGDDVAVAALLDDAVNGGAEAPGAFAAAGDKRTTLRLAIEHLYQHAPAPSAETALPDGAPFGQILVNKDTCTLCMSCVGVCPASALADGEDLPQLRFIEGNCVQCGLCATACPENAIELAPRYLFDPEARRAARTLNEEAPFHCIACGKPFATRKMMDSMTQKLKGHWMFQSDPALRRIQMCGDCRVRDVFKTEQSGQTPNAS